jgi:hypothetical protein
MGGIREACSSVELRTSLIQTFETLHRIHGLVGTILDGRPIFFTHVVFGGVILLLCFKRVSNISTAK